MRVHASDLPVQFGREQREVWADAIALERRWECAKLSAGARGWESETGRCEYMSSCFVALFRTAY